MSGVPNRASFELHLPAELARGIQRSSYNGRSADARLGAESRAMEERQDAKQAGLGDAASSHRADAPDGVGRRA